MTTSPYKLFSFAIFIILTSLDNVASSLLPPLYAVLSNQFAIPEARLGYLTAVYALLVAASALFWGYRGDQGNRRHLLLVGTLVWAVGLGLSGTAATFAQFALWQLTAALGIGCIASIGFSLVSDIIPAHRRGFAISLWSMCQALGAGLGTLLAGGLGAVAWNRPFLAVAAAGLFFACFYPFTQEQLRGRAEPELAPLFASGGSYSYHIHRADLATIFSRPANRWLMVQSFCFSLAYGSTIWVPRWAVAKVQAIGYDLETATFAGNLFVLLFNVGVLFAVPAGHLGDRWQRKRLNGRIHIAAAGLLTSIPFFILLFFWPFHNVVLTPSDNLFITTWSVVVALFTNGWLMGAFLLSTMGMVLYSAEPPNWAALITDINLPEHRGTVIGVHRVSRALANALSISLAGIVFQSLTAHFPTPTNYALGLALFQLLVIPAGVCYYLAGRTVPDDIKTVRRTLVERAKQEQ